MERIHLIHMVESSKRQLWLEKLIYSLELNSISQSVVTLEKEGDLKNFLSEKSVKVLSPISESLLSITLLGTKLVCQAKKSNSVNFLLLHGHKASFIGAIAARILNLNYGIVHHVQPKYFQLLRTQYPLRSLIHRFIYRYYVRRAKIIQSLSREVTLSLTTLGCAAEKMVAIGHGVDFDAFQESLKNPLGDIFKKPGFPRILMVGRLAWEKNYPLALEVFAKLSKSYPEAQLLIAGAGPVEIEIKSLIKRFNLSKNVSLLGSVENVPELMVYSDLLMHVSLTESYGQVYIEACLSSLPIFTFPTGIAIDLYEESNPLIHLLTCSNPEWISEQICQFLMSSPKRQSPNISLMRNLYRKHNQEEVFQEMSKYIKGLISELNQDKKN